MTQSKFAFSRMNYLIMIAGIVLILIGFFVMSIDKETYGFGFLGLTLGPIIVMLGFLVEFAAIFYKDKAKTESSSETKE